MKNINNKTVKIIINCYHSATSLGLQHHRAINMASNLLVNITKNLKQKDSERITLSIINEYLEKIPGSCKKFDVDSFNNSQNMYTEKCRFCESHEDCIKNFTIKNINSLKDD